MSYKTFFMKLSSLTTIFIKSFVISQLELFVIEFLVVKLKGIIRMIKVWRV